ncbi:non-ribosomal peptide synthetase [Burkholderia singularis]|uniref:non-ribosomal peptide synthetase n=1 Tax=Burkholderia singularis TaxID=1503053 RepID=UPI0009EA764D|nr:non-ribosomal peptide synthetase [Burkholderia singularis]
MTGAQIRPGQPSVNQLSRAQQEIWLAQAPLGRADPYLIAEIVVLAGSLDVDRLVDAARWVVEHDETARWIVVEDADRTRMAECGSPPNVLEVVDMTGRPDALTSGWRWLSTWMSKPVTTADQRAWTLVLVRVSPHLHLLAARGHHAVVDGHTARWRLWWIARTYRALCAGTGAPLIDNTGVVTLLRAEADYRQSNAFLRDRDYWLSAMSAVTEPLIPPARADDAPARVRRRLPKPLSDAVESVGERRPGATAVIAGCLAVLLGTGNALLELSVSGRNSDALRRTAGVAVNRVPLWVPMRPDDTLESVIGAARAAIRAALRHQRYRREDIRRDLLAAGRPAPTGVGLNMLLFDELRPDFGAVSATIHPRNYGPVPGLELTVCRPAAGGSLELQLAGNPVQYPVARLRGLLERLCALIEQAVHSPRGTVRELNAAYDAHARRQRPSAPVPAWQSWPAAFAQQARRTPFVPAVAAGSRSLTYQAFEAWCARLARRLAQHGVVKGDVVAVTGGPSPLAAAAMLAVWRLGAIYLPLDLGQPTLRLTHMLDVAAPVIAIVEPDAVGAPALADIPTVVAEPLPQPCADADGNVAHDADADAAMPPSALHPQDPAYLIFTSGSSGHPKGVMVSHRGILGMARAHADVMNAGVGARVLQFAPITFDASIAELTLALCCGATAVFAGSDELSHGDGIARVITAYGVSHLIMVPSVLATVPEERVPAGLRIVVAGERPGPGLLRRWRARHRLRNAYGPTEATVCATISEELDDLAIVPIGRPIPGCTAQVVDERLRPVPAGTIGELLIGGDGVALGYLHHPTLTVEPFVTGPDGTRHYRSGDRVRQLPDGQLEFVGRCDRQIKLRGRRIEPGEVEAALQTHPDVRQAAVIATGEQLLAYAVLAGEATPHALVLYLAHRLPRYLAPDRVIVVDRLPRTRHGKIDYHALPELASAPALAPAHPRMGAQTPAQSPQEHLLCQIFAEVLGRDQVGRADNFFELGGHSMLAAKLVLKVRTMLGADLSMRSLLEAPSPQALSASLDLPGSVTDSLDVLLPLRRTGRRPALFCMHPATGLGWGYAGLLRHLPDRPIVALQARTLSDAGYWPESVEELTADYLARIIAFQPAGPYHLLGWSFGGRVAFEMAVALQRAGQQVGSVILLDSSPPPTPFDASTDDFDRDQTLRRYFLTMLAETTPIEPSIWDAAPLSEIKVELDRLGSPYALLSDDHFQRMFDLHKRNYALSRRYVPRGKFRGRLIYVRALETDQPGNPDPQRKAEQWAAHVDGNTVERPVAGTHNGLSAESSLAQIGRVLADELERNEFGHGYAH